jgi:hypothetical protein
MTWRASGLEEDNQFPPTGVHKYRSERDRENTHTHTYTDSWTHSCKAQGQGGFVRSRPLLANEKSQDGTRVEQSAANGKGEGQGASSNFLKAGVPTGALTPSCLNQCFQELLSEPVFPLSICAFIYVFLSLYTVCMQACVCLRVCGCVYVCV